MWDGRKPNDGERGRRKKPHMLRGKRRKRGGSKESHPQKRREREGKGTQHTPESGKIFAPSPSSPHSTHAGSWGERERK